MWWLLACAHPVPPAGPDGLAHEVVSDGPAAARLRRDDAELVLFYAGEQHGSLLTCGCPRLKKGSMARLARYLDLARGPRSVLVYGGHFLSDLTNTDLSLRGDVPTQNRWMIEGLRKLPWDAINVGANDLAGLGGIETAGLPLVSLNIRGPGIVPWVIVEREGQKIGLTGISGSGLAFEAPAPYTVGPPEAVGPRLAELDAQVDRLVLSAFTAADAARALVREVPGIDVVIDVAVHRDALPPAKLGDTVWEIGRAHV